MATVVARGANGAAARAEAREAAASAAAVVVPAVLPMVRLVACLAVEDLAREMGAAKALGA